LPFLVGFRPAHQDRQARLADGDVVDVEGDKLGATQRRAEADQQDRAIPAAPRLVDPQLQAEHRTAAPGCSVKASAQAQHR
jgi:hypothetical protein